MNDTSPKRETPATAKAYSISVWMTHACVYLFVLTALLVGRALFVVDMNPILHNTMIITDLMLFLVFFLWGSFLIERRPKQLRR